MWEHGPSDWCDEALVRPVCSNSLVVGGRKTASYLRKCAKFSVSTSLPTCLIAGWSHKALRITGEDCAFSNDKRIECENCGLSLMHRRTLTMEVASLSNGARSLFGKCNGCGQKYVCGELPLLVVQERKVESELMTEADTSMTNGSSSYGSERTPNSRIGTQKTPSCNGRVANIKRKDKQRRGSALEKLLKEDDSEADRSLTGFLNSFSM